MYWWGHAGQLFKSILLKLCIYNNQTIKQWRPAFGGGQALNFLILIKKFNWPWSRTWSRSTRDRDQTHETGLRPMPRPNYSKPRPRPLQTGLNTETRFRDLTSLCFEGLNTPKLFNRFVAQNSIARRVEQAVNWILCHRTTG